MNNDLNRFNNRNSQYVHNLVRDLASEQGNLSGNNVNALNNNNNNDNNYRGFDYAMNNYVRGLGNSLSNAGLTSLFSNETNGVSQMLGLIPNFVADLVWGNKYENKQNNSQREFHDGEH